ncbi:MAG: hypothetical protein R3300_07490 [Candidatus Promineifilaceae bacterium]|nr:hypothetical protein [Candidatus Promineifilaceae bacterium]
MTHLEPQSPSQNGRINVSTNPNAQTGGASALLGQETFIIYLNYFT